ncbi:MAG: hypothetical protein ACRCU2_22690, partial [Planktothrix sp.]
LETLKENGLSIPADVKKYSNFIAPQIYIESLLFMEKEVKILGCQPKKLQILNFIRRPKYSSLTEREALVIRMFLNKLIKKHYPK